MYRLIPTIVGQDSITQPDQVKPWPDLDLLNRLSCFGPQFNIKMSSDHYSKSHCGDKTIVLSPKWGFLYWQDNIFILNQGPGGRFKNTYELLNLRALKYSPVNKIHIFQCMGEIFCVEFQRYPLKFHTKYLTHTLKNMIFIQH